MTLKSNTVSRRIGPQTDKAIIEFIRMVEAATGLTVSFPQASDARERLKERDQAKLYTCKYVITVQSLKKRNSK